MTLVCWAKAVNPGLANYEFDTSASDPLFDNLKRILKSNPSAESLAKASQIQARYWSQIIR